MSSINKIPIRVEQTPTAEDFAIAQSILHEIHELLGRLLVSGEGGTIDLRSLPALNQASLGLLEKWLPTGEITAVVTGVGRTEVRETAYAGVWWLVYRNAKEDIITESIQVTEVPDLLKSQADDIEWGRKKLSGVLSSTEQQKFEGRAAE